MTIKSGISRYLRVGLKISSAFVLEIRTVQADFRNKLAEVIFQRSLSVWKLMRYIKGYGTKFAFAISTNLLYKITPVAIGFVVSLMVGHTLAGRFDAAQSLFIASIVLVIAGTLLHYLDILVAHDMAYRILADLRNVMYKKLDEIAPAATEDKQSGDLMSVTMEDVELLEWFYAHTISQTVVAFVVPLSVLILLGTFHWSLPLVLLLFIIALITIPFVMGKSSNKQGVNLRVKLGGLNARTVDGIQGIKDIVSFRWQKHFFKRFTDTAQEFNRASVSYESRAAAERGLMALLISAAALMMTVMIVRLSVSGVVEAHWILPLMSVSALIFIPLSEALNMSTNYGNIFAAAGRVFDVFQIEPCVHDTGTKKAEDVPNPQYVTASFCNVSFLYPSRAHVRAANTACGRTEKKEVVNPKVLDGVSFSFTKGESMALVGASGSGKSTSAKLLQRFWDVDSGKITINGINIKELTIDALREFVTLVPQEIYLFNMSERENLLLAKPSASEDEIRNACHNAQLDSVIEKLPKGTDTIIGERGLRLSGGEKQRIAIAQAFLKNSPLLVLDESSANLDSETERLINSAVSQLKKGRATLIIAHRISTIRSADRIVFLHNGKVKGTGTYDELISNHPEFSDLMGVK